MRLILLFLTISLMGCSNTPYRDDYAQYTNLINHNDVLNQSSIQFHFVDNMNIDLRGNYVHQDAPNSSGVVYHGGAGLAGLLAQVAVHATVVNSQKNSLLSKEQQTANNYISSLIDKTNEIPLTSLINDPDIIVSNEHELTNTTVRIKPIFFSNKDMTEFSVKSIVWLPVDNEKTKRKSKNNKNRAKQRYKNMVHVYAKKLSTNEQKDINNSDGKLLLSILSSLLNKSIEIARKDLTGQYNKDSKTSSTFMIESNNNKEVFRGTLISNDCEYDVIQDLRSWFIAIPKSTITSNCQS